MKNKLILTIATLVLGAAAVFGITHVYAQSPAPTIPSIIQKLADRFGLNVSDVKAVFDADKQERKAAMQTKFETQLTQDVTDGKITAAQKQLILDKRKELEANRQTNFANLQNLTPDQRKAAFTARRQDLEAWAKQNNIDLKYLRGGFGMRGHWHMK